jgi:hypothetical protein
MLEQSGKPLGLVDNCDLWMGVDGVPEHRRPRPQAADDEEARVPGIGQVVEHACIVAGLGDPTWGESLPCNGFVRLGRSRYDAGTLDPYSSPRWSSLTFYVSSTKSWLMAGWWARWSPWELASIER